MGRMSDARKRARESAPGSRAGEEAPRRAGAGAARASDKPGAWLTQDEAPVLGADAAGPVGGKTGRVALPSSGLAEDILAMAEAAQVSANPDPAALGELPAPAPLAEAPARAHAVSFFSAPLREERKAAEAAEHLATFFLAKEEYGVDVRWVQEIIRVGAITLVPRAPEFIKGVINLRGRIVPVIDLKKKLGVGEVDVSARQARIVVVRLKERQLGLLVDGASQVLKVPLASIEDAPDEVSEIDTQAIRGVAKLTDRLIILMDLERVLSLELRESAQLTS